jgi:arylsulfatase A-like enzyme
LHTGGNTITWGNVHFELSHPYEGPTLVSTLRERGYATALYSSGDMHFENLDGYFGTLGFDQIVHAGLQNDEWRERYAVHSWGVAEDAMRSDAVRWMVEVRKRADKPFLLEYLTVSTHHPYGVFAGLPLAFGGDDLESRYRSALHYTDSFLGRLFEEMELNGMLDETLILVVGDHGEAFGKLHPKNFTHKNRLYEENVRSFLLVLAPGSALGPVTSDRVGTLGDVLPTLLRALGEEPEGLAGQSLWPGDYDLRTVYFHKSAKPEQWGLRDGRWKFIGRRVGKGYDELYDLELDPDEQNDRSADHPERIARYQNRAAQWYAAANRTYTANLRGYDLGGVGELTDEEVRSYGPKRLAVGVRGPDGRGVDRDTILPDDQLVAWSLWVPYLEDTPVRFVWTDPSGGRHEQRVVVQRDWSQARVLFKGPRPLEVGAWRIAIWEGGRELLGRSFEVRSAR